MQRAALQKVAMITGASRGIGRAIALRLSHDGYNIALNDIPVMQKELEAVQQAIVDSGRESVICMGDVTVEADVVRMVDTAVEKLGSLDVMVANAGVCTTNSIMDASLAELHKMFAVNVDGVFLCYKYAAKQMIKQGRGGRIIGAASMAGKQGWKQLAGYSASKFAVRGITQAAASDLAPYGITVNAYAPGGVDTNMLKVIRDGIAQVGGEQAVPKPGEFTPKDSSPHHIAALVSYLVSEDAEQVTGQSVSINGGLFMD